MATVYQRASIEKTDAGAFSTNLGINKFAGREDPEAAYEGKVLNAALVNWAATQGRVFITRVTLTFLYATGVLAFLGFLSTLSADSDQGDSAADHKKRYVCALSVVVNLVAVAHYKMITKIRNYSFGGSHKGEVFAGLEWTAFTPHDKKIAIGVEMAVDSIRHSDWAVSAHSAPAWRSNCANNPSHLHRCVRRSPSSSSPTRSTTCAASSPMASPPRLARSLSRLVPPPAVRCSWSS